MSVEVRKTGKGVEIVIVDGKGVEKAVNPYAGIDERAAMAEGAKARLHTDVASDLLTQGVGRALPNGTLKAHATAAAQHRKAAAMYPEGTFMRKHHEATAREIDKTVGEIHRGEWGKIHPEDKVDAVEKAVDAVEKARFSELTHYDDIAHAAHADYRPEASKSLTPRDARLQIASLPVGSKVLFRHGADLHCMSRDEASKSLLAIDDQETPSVVLGDEASKSIGRDVTNENGVAERMHHEPLWRGHKANQYMDDYLRDPTPQNAEPAIHEHLMASKKHMSYAADADGPEATRHHEYMSHLHNAAAMYLIDKHGDKQAERNSAALAAARAKA